VEGYAGVGVSLWIVDREAYTNKPPFKNWEVQRNDQSCVHLQFSLASLHKHAIS
jgi:hypothetical protein